MLTKTALAAKVANFFFSNGFWFWLNERSNHLLQKYHFEFPCFSWKILLCLLSKMIHMYTTVCHRHRQQTDRQILWHHIRGYADFLFRLNLLPPYLLGFQGDKNSLFTADDAMLIFSNNLFNPPFLKVVLSFDKKSFFSNSLIILLQVSFFKLFV